MAPLFRVPIATGGDFTCTCPAEKVYLVEFTSLPDNRLTAAFNEAFLIILDLIEAKLPRGVVVTTSGIEKFYSNGLDLSDLGNPSTFFAQSLFPLLARLLSYPMPTVALINGHAFAGGLILALHHDYRVQRSTRGYLSMNEVIFGAKMDPALLGIFKAKIPSPGTFRRLILEGDRFTPQQALDEGVVDRLGDRDSALAFVKEKGLTGKGESGVYGGLKEEMYREQLDLLRHSPSSAEWRAATEARLQLQQSERDGRLQRWSNRLSDSKL